MGKDLVADGLLLGARSMEYLHALIIQNRGSIRCRLVFHIARREVRYALSSVALAGKSKRGLLSEGLPASRASPTDNETKDRLNHRFAKDVELARTSLVPLEQVGRGPAGGAIRQLTADLVA
jgi:hypothetical protein